MYKVFRQFFSTNAFFLRRLRAGKENPFHESTGPIKELLTLIHAKVMCGSFPVRLSATFLWILLGWWLAVGLLAKLHDVRLGAHRLQPMF
jgi:hypothetical protein